MGLSVQGLAKSIAWDGEGATCLLEVRVTGESARRQGMQPQHTPFLSYTTADCLFEHAWDNMRTQRPRVHH